MDKWSQEKKNRYAKEAERINKAWGEKNERKRRERVANALEFEKDKTKVNNEDSEDWTSKNYNTLPIMEKDKQEKFGDRRKKPVFQSLRERFTNAFGFEKDKTKVNNEASTSKSQSSSSKSQKM